jgi:GNAT superfamily N-acetyltransferase
VAAAHARALDSVGWVPLTVRRLTLDDDVEAFGRIVVASYQALPGLPDDPGYIEELLDVASRVGQATVLGALDGSSPLGCVTYVDDPDSPYAEHLRDGEASFRMLAVSPSAQGRGVGGALVLACLDRARAAGRASVFIHSGTWMTAAHRLYGRLGFVPVPQRDWQVSEQLRLLGFSCAV